MDFKVYDKEDEATLSDTADSALLQLKQYDTGLIMQGMSEECIISRALSLREKSV